MPRFRSGLTGAARLAASWFFLWAGFWLVVFAMIRSADPDSIDPGEPAAFARIFAWLGLSSGVIFGCLANFASGRGAGLLRCVLWGAVAAAAPVAMLGKFNQILVLAPAGAAIGCALACVGRKAAGLGAGGGVWLAAARFVSRGFPKGAAS